MTNYLNEESLRKCSVITLKEKKEGTNVLKTFEKLSKNFPKNFPKTLVFLVRNVSDCSKKLSKNETNTLPKKFSVKCKKEVA